MRLQLVCLLILIISALGKKAPHLADDGKGLPVRDGGDLVENVPRVSEHIAIDAELVRYRLPPLRPGASWEVRISLPSTNPVVAKLWLSASPGGADGTPGEALLDVPAERMGAPRGLLAAAAAPRLRRAGRALLQAEKVEFRTDGAGGVVAAGERLGPRPYVFFKAERWARHVDGPAAGPPLLHYDVLLERAHLGVPASGLPLAAAAAVLVAAAAACAPLWARAAVPALLRWIAAGDGPRRD